MNPLVTRALVLLIFAGLGVYGYYTLTGPQGLPALAQRRQEIRKLEEANANLQRENELKRDRIRKLKESLSEQDLEIRKKLKMLHENETEFILPNTTPAQPQASTPGVTQ